MKAGAFKDPTFVDASKQVTLLMIDIDKNPDLARKWGIRAIPDMRFLDTEGKEIGKYKGKRSAESFAQQFKDVAEKHGVKSGGEEDKKPEDEKVVVEWMTDFAKAREDSIKGHKALVVIFADESEPVQKTIAAFNNAKFKKTIERVTFAKIKFDKDSDTAKKLKVETAGMIVVLNPDEADLAKAVLATKAAPLSADELKALIGPFETPGFKCDKCGKTSFTKQTCDGAEMKPVEKKD